MKLTCQYHLQIKAPSMRTTVSRFIRFLSSLSGYASKTGDPLISMQVAQLQNIHQFLYYFIKVEKGFLQIWMLHQNVLFTRCQNKTFYLILPIKFYSASLTASLHFITSIDKPHAIYSVINIPN